MIKEELREARISDLGEISLLEKRCFGAQAYPEWFLRTLMLAAPSLFIVYSVGGKIVGYASAVIRRNIICHVMSICVDPSMRRRGIGRSLLLELEERFRGKGCFVSRLEVSYVNMPALKLYLGLGYRPALYKAQYYPGGEPALVMYKVLKG